MRRRRVASAADGGSAVVEFVFVAVCLLIPVAYVVGCAATVETAAYAATQAAREAGRAFVSAGGVREGRADADVAARLAFGDQGLDLPPDALRITCVGGACLAPGSAVVVDVAWAVRLPLLPDHVAVPVSATHRVPVDRFRADPDDA